MSRRFALFVVLGLIAAGIFWYETFPQHRPHESSVSTTVTQSQSKIPTDTAPHSALRNSQSAVVASHLADDLNSPAGDVHRDLQIISDVLAAYRSNFPHDGNPWGDNAEITAQLTGRNRYHLALIPQGHPAISAKGELCDRWGTPYFFHAESGTHMAIRSAGPDRKMWTADDVALEP